MTHLVFGFQILVLALIMGVTKDALAGPVRTLMLLTCFAAFIYFAGAYKKKLREAKETPEEKGARIRNRDGLSDLMLAAADGKVAEVQRLISAGADANAISKVGSTALMYAAINGHADVVQELISAGAKTDIKAKSGSTALSLAEKAGHLAVADLLR